MEWLLFLVVMASAVFLLTYFSSLRVPASSQLFSRNKNSPSVSIIICAKNEAVNLVQNLPQVLQQHYENFEVIVVNDGSTDETAQVLQQFQKKYAHLKVINIAQEEKAMPGKKWLLYKAVQQAQHEVVLLTDADCFPATNQWLKSMAAHTFSGAKVVLGYSPYWKGRGTRDEERRTDFSIRNTQYSILTSLQHFESTQTAWQYFSNAMNGKAYMGVGRNMLLNKRDYMKWFETTTHKTAGGDDDLFVNWLARDEGRMTKGEGREKNKIAVCLDEAAFVYTKAKESYWKWLAQKARHASASYHYSWNNKVKLFAFAMAQFGIYAGCIALMFLSKASFLVALAFVFAWSFAQVALSRKAYKVLRQHELLLWIPLLQPLYVFSISLIFLLTFIKRSDTWN